MVTTQVLGEEAHAAPLHWMRKSAQTTDQIAKHGNRLDPVEDLQGYTSFYASMCEAWSFSFSFSISTHVVQYLKVISTGKFNKYADVDSMFPRLNA